MPKSRKRTPFKLTKRLKKHLRDLGLTSGEAYLSWCKEHGFEPTLKKSQKEVEAEYQYFAYPPEPTPTYNATQRKQLIGNITRLWEGKQEIRNGDADVLRGLEKHLSKIGWPEDNQTLLFLQFLAQNSNLLFSQESLNKVMKLATHQDRWIRDYQSWKAESQGIESQYRSLVNHLFVKYSVPEFVFQGFQRKRISQELFFHLGTGKSVRSFEWFPIQLNRREANKFLQAPSHCSLEEALTYAQVIALGGSVDLFQAVHRCFRRKQFEHHTFWMKVVAFFVKHPLLRPDDFGPVIDYIEAMKFTPQRIRKKDGQVVDGEARKPDFSMKNRNPVTLLREMQRWHQALNHNGRYTSWENVSLEWETCGVEDQVMKTKSEKGNSTVCWEFTELLSGEDLLIEGRTFNHCVASYAGKCFRGESRIFSLSCDGKKKLTIELHLPHKQIIQVRGKSNRVATREENTIIQRWASINGLGFQY